MTHKVRQLRKPHYFEVEIPKTQSLNQVFTALTEQGIEVLSMRNKSNRLEELFVQLTENGQS